MVQTTITGKGGKFILADNGVEISTHKNLAEAQDADKAYMLGKMAELQAALAAANAPKAAKATEPVELSVNEKGQLRCYFGDRRKMGKFPAFQLHRDQFKLLAEHWPSIVATFEASADKLTDVGPILDAYYAGKAPKA
jgi:hypothetical protein